MSVKLSVVVPVFNTEKYLRECIDSILNQTFTDMEIILVDNKSTDDSGKICDEYGRKDRRIRVIHREEHGWVGDGRNDGIEAASGEWITFVDADDWIEQDCYEILFKELGNRDVDIFCEGGRFEDYPTKKNIKVLGMGDFDYSKKKELDFVRQYVIVPVMKRRITLASPWDKLYKAEFLKRNHLKYADDILYADDLYFNYLVFSKAERIAGCKYIGYHYRQRYDSIINGYKSDCPNKIYHFLRRLQNSLQQNETNDIWSAAFEGRTMSAFCYMLKHYLFHEQNQNSYLKKKAEVDRWKKKEIYKISIDSKSNKLLTRKQIIIKYILRTSFVFPLVILVKINNWREKEAYG